MERCKSREVREEDFTCEATLATSNTQKSFAESPTNGSR